VYLLMAYIGGSWGIAGVEPHEECAVNFISAVDDTFGEGAAFVVRLPNKDDDDSSDDHADLSKLLSNLSSGSLDVDSELAELLKNHKNED